MEADLEYHSKLSRLMGNCTGMSSPISDFNVKDRVGVLMRSCRVESSGFKAAGAISWKMCC